MIVSAVGDEIVIVHPLERLSAAELAAVVAGPALYLLGHALVRLRMAGSVSWKRLGGAGACVAVAGTGAFAPALVVAALVLAVLVVVIGLERLAAHRRSARGELSPLEQLEVGSAGIR